MKENKEIPIMPSLRKMEIGDEITFPIERMSSVKTVCTNCGLQWNKVFTTSVKREERMIIVKRIK